MVKLNQIVNDNKILVWLDRNHRREKKEGVRMERTDTNLLIKIRGKILRRRYHSSLVEKMSV